MGAFLEVLFSPLSPRFGLWQFDKERTHRLCTRGGMLESFLQEPERLTGDDVMLLLKLIFHRQDTQELLKKLLEREKPETP